MVLRFKGGPRLQRGRGIGGILRVLKSVFSPVVHSLGRTAIKAAKSSTGRLIGRKIKEQAIDSALNLTSNALKGNDLESSLQTEVQSAKETAANTLDQIRANRKRKRRVGRGVGVLPKKVKFYTATGMKKKHSRKKIKNVTRKKPVKKNKHHVTFRKRSMKKNNNKKKHIFNL